MSSCLLSAAAMDLHAAVGDRLAVADADGLNDEDRAMIVEMARVALAVFLPDHSPSPPAAAVRKETP